MLEVVLLNLLLNRFGGVVQAKEMVLSRVQQWTAFKNSLNLFWANEQLEVFNEMIVCVIHICGVHDLLIIYYK